METRVWSPCKKEDLNWAEGEVIMGTTRVSFKPPPQGNFTTLEVFLLVTNYVAKLQDKNYEFSVSMCFKSSLCCF